MEWEAELSTLGIPHTTLPRASAVAAATPVVQVNHGPPPSAHEEVRGAQATALPAGHIAPSAPIREAQTPQPAGMVAGPSAASDAPSIGQPVDRRARLAMLDQQVRSCARCELAKGRTQTVFARGNPDSPIAFVGEGPGQDEDRLGSPLVGPAGQLLDKMVVAMGFGRDDVYICNVVKCRPPGNRTPLPVEAQACAPFLLGQLEAVQPRVIVALGRCAAENMGLVGTGGWRGRWGKFQGVDVMPTYHPAFLLRSPEYKRPVWEDLQQVMARLKQPG